MKEQYDENYQPMTPTKIITATHGNVTVVTKLYGAVTDARYARERAAAHRRAEQLDAQPEKPRRDPLDYGNYMM